MINLLFLLPSFTFGGAERTSLNLLNGIDKSGFRICLVTSRNIFQYFQHAGIERFIPIEDIGTDVWYKGIRRFMSDVATTGALLKKENPDIAFGMMHYPSSLLTFAKKTYNLRSKMIVSPRGPSTEYLRYFEKEFFRKTYLKFIFSFFCRFSDGIVVASQGMRDECIRYFHADSGKIVPRTSSTRLHGSGIHSGSGRKSFRRARARPHVLREDRGGLLG